MKTESKKHYRKLKKFVHKLGIKNAESDDLVEDFMEAIEASMFRGGKPDACFVGLNTFLSLDELLKK